MNGPALVSWSPGQTRVMVPAVCCPHCGAVNVYRRSSSNGAPERWECRECTGGAWKMPSGTHTTPARTVLV